MKALKALSLAGLALALTGSMTLFSCNGGGSSKSATDSTASSASGVENTILGAGSTFDYPLFSKAFSEYNKTTGLKVNYQSIGSGGGILQLTNKTVDFGASDAVLTAEQEQKIGVPVLHIPITCGAVVISYNLPDLKDTLKLNSDVLADIYLGTITKWNDPKIAAINKGVKLPNTDIVVAHRADGSGTTDIFTTYLTKVNPEWSSKVGHSTAVNWPVGLGGKGNEGVAGVIKQTPGGIGYIELAYAIQNNMSFAKMQNKSGNFIVPTVASTSASANVELPADGKVSLTNTDAPDGYPITGFSWVVIYKEQKYNGRSMDQANNLLKLMWWMIHEGQQYSNALNYAPLPPAAVKVGESILKSSTYDGKQILQQQ